MENWKEGRMGKGFWAEKKFWGWWEEKGFGERGDK